MLLSTLILLPLLGTLTIFVFYTDKKNESNSKFSLNLNLIRSNFQAHPFHLVSPSPWPFYTSITLFTLTLSAVLTFHNFSNSLILLYLGLICVVYSMCLWFRDVTNNEKDLDRGIYYELRPFVILDILFFLAIFWFLLASFSNSLILYTSGLICVFYFISLRFQEFFLNKEIYLKNWTERLFLIKVLFFFIFIKFKNFIDAALYILKVEGLVSCLFFIGIKFYLLILIFYSFIVIPTLLYNISSFLFFNSISEMMAMFGFSGVETPPSTPPPPSDPSNNVYKYPQTLTEGRMNFGGEVKGRYDAVNNKFFGIFYARPDIVNNHTPLYIWGHLKLCFPESDIHITAEGNHVIVFNNDIHQPVIKYYEGTNGGMDRGFNVRAFIPDNWTSNNEPVRCNIGRYFIVMKHYEHANFHLIYKDMFV